MSVPSPLRLNVRAALHQGRESGLADVVALRVDLAVLVGLSDFAELAEQLDLVGHCSGAFAWCETGHVFLLLPQKAASR